MSKIQNLCDKLDIKWNGKTDRVSLFVLLEKISDKLDNCDIKTINIDEFNVNLRKFENNKLMVNCPIKEDAIDFLEQLRQLGFVWASGQPLIESNNRWDSYKENTVYMNEGNRKVVFYTKSSGVNRNKKLIIWKKGVSKILR